MSRLAFALVDAILPISNHTVSEHVRSPGQSPRLFLGTGVGSETSGAVGLGGQVPGNGDRLVGVSRGSAARESGDDRIGVAVRENAAGRPPIRLPERIDGRNHAVYRRHPTVTGPASQQIAEVY